MACNGIGTPRLLLNSASARFPNGLANSSGLVGRNLMLHPWPLVSRLCRRGAGWRPRAHHLLWSKQFYETDPCARLRARLHAAVRPRHRPGQRGDHQRRRPAVCRGASDHHRVYRELFDRRLQIGVACEDLPEEHNRVTLDPVLKDSNGIPAPRIDYAISENTRRMMEHGIARAEEILTAAGATRLYASRTVLNSPGHLLGTARMGNDPERSVVNAWGRCHDVKNLFIVDGSIWVTSGGVNPTSTIQALALYIADR